MRKLKEKLLDLWLWVVAVFFTLVGICALFFWLGLLVLLVIRLIKGVPA